MTIVETCAVTRGVDTLLDAHVAAALYGVGGLLGVESFPTTPAGYTALTSWLCRGDGVEGVGLPGLAAGGTIGPVDLEDGDPGGEVRARPAP